MPFARKADKVDFYTDVNNLKKRWKRVADDVNSTPSQVIEANKRLEYLLASSSEEKKIQRIMRLAEYGAKLGIRINAALEVTEDVNELLDNMLAALATPAKEDSSVIQG
jgi:hypothetical protein